MCGIFGIVGRNKTFRSDFKTLAKHATQRGKDSSGVMTYKGSYSVERAEYDLMTLIKNKRYEKLELVLGVARLATNGARDSQPCVRDNICVFHNGIIVNVDQLFKREQLQRYYESDTEIIAALVEKYQSQVAIEKLHEIILSKCQGVIATAIAMPKIGKLILLSNNGNLYTSEKDGIYYFSSEKYHLQNIGCEKIENLKAKSKILDIPKANEVRIPTVDYKVKRIDLVAKLTNSFKDEKLLEDIRPELIRCSKCLLPHTMPFINFDNKGVCNYCRNYKIRSNPKPTSELLKLIEPYRKVNSEDCIVPFSGGRDSSYGLHLIVKELGLKPITYTYDWGMTTDLARRNISRLCSKLGVENIIVAADIAKKRNNIKKNIEAWQKSPNLGMISLFTAGDKHFYKYVETIKKQTNIKLNLWGSSPFEVTHFKSGFLGIPPDFEEKRVYSHGIMKQIRYQYLRLKAMTKSPSYFNSSLWDNLSGEYYRSFRKKTDYYYVYDYWEWKENLIEDTLINEYDWELSPDTKTTWRIGDGTAAFYNYIYHTVAGFTEHDTFRSNQIREGVISRSDALALIEEENKPRYQSIVMYLDLIGLDFKEVIKRINTIPKLWHQTYPKNY